MQLGSKETAKIKFNLIADPDAEANIYKVPLKIEYSDELGANYSKNLIVGLIIGFLIKKFFKILLILAIVTIFLSYLGFFTINLSTLKNIADTYGAQVIHYGTILIGILPIGLGLFVGLVIGLLLG